MFSTRLCWLQHQCYYLLRLKPNPQRDKYFWYFMCCPLGQRQFHKMVTSTAKETITVPKPKTMLFHSQQFPNNERIAGELDASDAKMDVLKRLQSESAKELDALMPSILSRAFSGEL